MSGYVPAVGVNNVMRRSFNEFEGAYNYGPVGTSMARSYVTPYGPSQYRYWFKNLYTLFYKNI